jgi:DNA-binding SARP family transcriptional activator
VPGGNTARLLALLVSRADQPVSMAEIIEAVWPDVDHEFISPQQVERLVAGLRQLLGSGARDVIPVRKHDRYRFDASDGPVWVDTVEFDRSARAAEASLEAGDVECARRLALAALSLWQGDPVVLPDEWTDLKHRLSTVRIVAADAAIRSGDHRQAATELASFVEEHPDDEAGWTLLVAAQLGCGERVLAAQTCAHAAGRFARYGGVGPRLAALCRPLTASSESEPDVEPATRSALAATVRPPAAAVEAPRARRLVAKPTIPGIRRRPRLAAILIVLVALGGAVAADLGLRGGRTRGPGFLTVYDLEADCQGPRTHHCGLGLAQDPYADYTLSNIVGYVWHGDRLAVDCLVSDGSRVSSEDGTPTTSWYRVNVPDHHPAKAWLPAIRVRAGTEPDVPACTDAQVPVTDRATN